MNQNIILENLNNNRCNINSNNDKNDSNISGINNNNKDKPSELAKQVIAKLKDLDVKFKQLTQLDNPVLKHLIDIACQYNHQYATSNINKLLLQNLNFSKIMIKYRDRINNAIPRFNLVTKHKVTYDPTKHSTHKDLIDLVDQAYYHNFMRIIPNMIVQE